MKPRHELLVIDEGELAGDPLALVSHPVAPVGLGVSFFGRSEKIGGLPFPSAGPGFRFRGLRSTLGQIAGTPFLRLGLLSALSGI